MLQRLKSFCNSIGISLDENLIDSQYHFYFPLKSEHVGEGDSVRVFNSNLSDCECAKTRLVEEAFRGTGSLLISLVVGEDIGEVMSEERTSKCDPECDVKRSDDRTMRRSVRDGRNQDGDEMSSDISITAVNNSIKKFKASIEDTLKQRRTNSPANEDLVEAESKNSRNCGTAYTQPNKDFRTTTVTATDVGDGQQSKNCICPGSAGLWRNIAVSKTDDVLGTVAKPSVRYQDDEKPEKDPVNSGPVDDCVCCACPATKDESKEGQKVFVDSQNDVPDNKKVSEETKSVPDCSPKCPLPDDNKKEKENLIPTFKSQEINVSPSVCDPTCELLPKISECDPSCELITPTVMKKTSEKECDPSCELLPIPKKQSESDCAPDCPRDIKQPNEKECAPDCPRDTKQPDEKVDLFKELETPSNIKKAPGKKASKPKSQMQKNNILKKPIEKDNEETPEEKECDPDCPFGANSKLIEENECGPTYENKSTSDIKKPEDQGSEKNISKFNEKPCDLTCPGAEEPENDKECDEDCPYSSKNLDKDKECKPDCPFSNKNENISGDEKEFNPESPLKEENLLKEQDCDPECTKTPRQADSKCVPDCPAIKPNVPEQKDCDPEPPPTEPKCVVDCPGNKLNVPANKECDTTFEKIIEKPVAEKECDPTCEKTIVKPVAGKECDPTCEKTIEKPVAEKECDPTCKKTIEKPVAEKECDPNCEKTIKEPVAEKECAPECDLVPSKPQNVPQCKPDCAYKPELMPILKESPNKDASSKNMGENKDKTGSGCPPQCTFNIAETDSKGKSEIDRLCDPFNIMPSLKKDVCLSTCHVNFEIDKDSVCVPDCPFNESLINNDTGDSVCERCSRPDFSKKKTVAVEKKPSVCGYPGLKTCNPCENLGQKAEAEDQVSPVPDPLPLALEELGEVAVNADGRPIVVMVTVVHEHAGEEIPERRSEYATTIDPETMRISGLYTHLDGNKSTAVSPSVAEDLNASIKATLLKDHIIEEDDASLETKEEQGLPSALQNKDPPDDDVLTDDVVKEIEQLVKSDELSSREVVKETIKERKSGAPLGSQSSKISDLKERSESSKISDLKERSESSKTSDLKEISESSKNSDLKESPSPLKTSETEVKPPESVQPILKGHSIMKSNTYHDDESIQPSVKESNASDNSESKESKKSKRSSIFSRTSSKSSDKSKKSKESKNSKSSKGSDNKSNDEDKKGKN